MKLNLDIVLKTITGEDVPEAELKTAISNALLASYEDERNLAGSVKAERFNLAVRVINGGEQEFNIDEAKMIKDLVGKGLSALFVGQIYNILEGNTDGS